MTFRPPLIITIYPRPKAPDQDYNVRILAQIAPNPSKPFHQDDWPRPAPPGKVQDSAAPANLYPWQHPNPSKPFHQDDWSQLATPGRPKAVGEAIGTLSPLLTPNPSRPFHKDDWSELAKPSRPKAQVDDFVNLRPNQSFFIINQDLWDNAVPSRPAKVDDFVNLLPVHTGTVVVTLPFNQDLWDNAALSRPKATDASLAPPPPLLTPNPSIPFNQGLWEGEPASAKAKVDDFVNLAPVQSTIVVHFPFSLSDWPLATLPQPKIIDTSIAGSAPLYEPNPAAPWAYLDSTILDPVPRVKVDDVVNLLPLQNPPVVQPPFIQGDWPSAVLARQKIAAESYSPDLSIYLPAPPFTFGQHEWPSAIPGRQKVYAESFGIDLPLKFPNPPRPFQQSIWDNATKAFPRAVEHLNFNPNTQPPPIIIPAKPDNLHFLADVGRLMSR